MPSVVNSVSLVNYLNGAGNYDVTSKDAKTRIYLPLHSGYGSSHLVARIAYVVVSDKGKIDPFSAVDSGLNAQLLGYSRRTSIKRV